ncbi:MAG: Gfo/Idh/MocA family oxidoreductase [Pseudomonadota bacterium]
MKRILIAGGGLIGARHVQSVKAHRDCILIGLVEPNASVSSDPGVARFSELSDVSGQVDGVILATPTHLHASQGAYAAMRGWHLLIEKPVASDIKSAHALLETITTSGVRSLVGHHRRYHPSVSALKRLISEGAIGAPVTASLIWAMRKPASYFEGNWRARDGSPVMINLVHDIDLLRHVLGDIVATSSLRGAGVRGADRIESGAIALAFASGATGTISFADTAPSPWGFEAATGENPNIGTTGQDMLWITGTKGAISYPSLSLWSGADWSNPAQKISEDCPVLARAPLDAQLDHFVDVIDGAAPLIDVADATLTLEVALQIEQSLAEQSSGDTNARSALA